MQGTWRDAFGPELVSGKEIKSIKTDKIPFYKRKRFWGTVISLASFAVRKYDPAAGEAVQITGNIVLAIGIGHGIIKSAPRYDGKPGVAYRVVDRLFTKIRNRKQLAR